MFHVTPMHRKPREGPGTVTETEWPPSGVYLSLRSLVVLTPGASGCADNLELHLQQTPHCPSNSRTAL